MGREEARRTHVRVFGFDADTDDIDTNTRFEYFRKVVVTNNGRSLALYKRIRDLFDLAYDVIPEVKALP
jgi:hypothetical protein